MSTIQIVGMFMIVATVGLLVYSAYLLLCTNNNLPRQPVESGKSRQRGKKR